MGNNDHNKQQMSRDVQRKSSSDNFVINNPVIKSYNSDNNDTGSAGNFAVGKKELVSILVAIALVAGTMLYVSFSGATKDQLSEEQKNERAEVFNSFGSLSLNKVEQSDTDKAIAGMGLSSEEKQELKQQVNKGTVDLVWITLWDNNAEDGDAVQIISSGYSTIVKLKHIPVQLAIPEPPSGVLAIKGVHDGGGGITVGMLSGSQKVPLPVMIENQILNVHVSTVQK